MPLFRIILKYSRPNPFLWTSHCSFSIQAEHPYTSRDRSTAAFLYHLLTTFSLLCNFTMWLHWRINIRSAYSFLDWCQSLLAWIHVFVLASCVDRTLRHIPFNQMTSRPIYLFHICIWRLAWKGTLHTVTRNKENIETWSMWKKEEINVINIVCKASQYIIW